jgi:pyridine nucleotide-disulfide oxidoreductase
MGATAAPSKTTAVIGAGPYGLSVAAHLLHANVSTRVFGMPMEFWRNMPAEMHLKSVWSASSLADPTGDYSLDRYCEAEHLAPAEPIPLSFFIDYAQWFQRHAVNEVEQAYVRRLSRRGQEFDLELSDGSHVRARRVVVAIGISRFAHVPAFARGLPPHLASHTGAHTDFASFRGSRVMVVGGGQSGLETAAFLLETGAQVELVTRRPVRWISRRLYARGGLARHLLYPPTDVGPPGLNWLCGSPRLMSRLPVGLRRRIEARAVRPAGAQWLRSRVEGKVPTRPETQIVEAWPCKSGLRLRLSDGSLRDVDHLFLGTGYHPDVGEIPFLDPALRDQVRQRAGLPVLDDGFESSVPGLHFVGGLAGWTFGPICRFVAGARAAARQVTRRAA